MSQKKSPYIHNMADTSNHTLNQLSDFNKDIFLRIVYSLVFYLICLVLLICLIYDYFNSKMILFNKLMKKNSIMIYDSDQKLSKKLKGISKKKKLKTIQ